MDPWDEYAADESGGAAVAEPGPWQDFQEPAPAGARGAAPAVDSVPSAPAKLDPAHDPFSFDAPAANSDVLAARNQIFRQKFGLKFRQQPGLWEQLTTPLAEIAHRLSPQELADAVDVLGTLPVPSESPYADLPDTATALEQLGELPARKPSGTEKAVAGAQQAVADSVNFFTSPLGIATLGTAKLPVLAQKAVAAAFVGQMAYHAPDQVRELGEGWKQKDPEQIARAAAGLGLTAAFVTEGARSVVKKGHGAEAEAAQPGPWEDFAAPETSAPETAPAAESAIVPPPEISPETGARVSPPAAPPEPVAAPEPVEPVQTSRQAEPPPSTTVLTDVAQHPVRELPIAELRLSKDVPNFKGEADPETGVVEGQKLGGSYQRLGTGPIVVWERLNGNKEVITGRHRFDLARRSGEKTIPAQTVREADGFTKDMALTFDAEANIRDGQGTVEDYATYFKGSSIGEAEARARGLLDRAKGASGWSLAKAASDDLYALWRAGKVGEDKAVAIARAAPGNPDLQALGSAQALKGKSIPEIQNFVKAVAAETGGRVDQLDMFGRNDAALKQAEEMASRAAAQQKSIAEQIRAVQSAAKRPDVAAKLGVDVKDPQGLLTRIGELKAELQRWENWPLHPDLVDHVKGISRPPAEPLTLAKPESVAEQQARLEAEAADAQRQAARQKMEQDAAAPLVGRGVDTTGDMFDQGAADNPLFAAKPKIHAMATGNPAHRGGPRAPGPALPTPPRAPVPVPHPSTVHPVRRWFAETRKDILKLVAPQALDGMARRVANIVREYNGEAALKVQQADEALHAWRNSFDRTPVRSDWVYDPAKPLPRNFAFMDESEHGGAGLTPEEQALKASIDAQFDDLVDDVHAIAPQALKKLITDYFPHIWKDPKEATRVFNELLSRRPLEGSKGFLKKRTKEYFIDGLRAGLKPVSDNPIDLVLLKQHEVRKFIMGQKVLAEAKAIGARKFVYIFEKPPEGWTMVEDRSSTVNAPPVVKVQEAFDAQMRAQTIELLDQLGVPHERLAKMRGKRWGEANEATGEIRTRFAGPDSVIWHELGHVLEFRYRMSRFLADTAVKQSELTELAKLRAGGAFTSKGFLKYIQDIDEKMATVLQAYLHAPEAMQRVAPTVKAEFQRFIQSRPELRAIDDIKPSLVIGTGKIDYPVNGMVTLGHYYMPEGAAAVLNNFLSPGLGRFGLFRTLRQSSNLLNGAQLGFSAFHLGFTSLDAAVSRAAVGLEYLADGRPVDAGMKLLSTPLAPVTNFLSGLRIQREMLQPGTGSAEIANLAKLATTAGLRATLDPFWKTEFTRKWVRAIHDGGVKGYSKTVMYTPFVALEQIMRPIAEGIVPRQKLGVFAEMATLAMQKLGPAASHEQVREAMARAADSTENRMGQMTYDNLFYNRVVKDLALIGFRAYGWQLGKYREAVGAAVDTLSQTKRLLAGERPELSHRMAYAMALPMVVGLVGAVFHRAMTGQNPQSMLDYYFPQTGQTDRNGRPQRVMLPSYVKDLVSDWHDFPNIKKMGASFYHKLNPMVAVMVDMLRNRDFYDVKVRNEDDPVWSQAGDLLKFSFKSAQPFSITGAQKLSEEHAGLAQWMLPFVGIVPAKKALTMTPAEAKAADITADLMPAGARTKEQAAKQELMHNILKQLREQPAAGREQMRQALQSSSISTEDVAHLLHRFPSPLQYQVNRMPVHEAMKIWDLATPEERTALRPLVQQKLMRAQTLLPSERARFLKLIQ